MLRKKKQIFFSLIEVTIAMAILAALIAASFSFFSSTQNVWSVTSARQEIFENARIALDLISRDLETAYFYDGKAPFWHWKPSSPLPGAYSSYQNGHLAFISQTSAKSNDDCISPFFEIKYQLYYASNRDNDTDRLNEGWIRRSVTGDKLSDNGGDNPKYNWNPNGNRNLTGSLNYFVNSNNGAAFTADNGSSGDLENGVWVDYQKIIPFVTDLSFTCDTDTDTNTIIQPDTTTVATNHSLASCKDLTYNSINIFPSVVTISITLMDKASWEKWISLCTSATEESDTARIFRERQQMTFSRMVYLGDRGQE